MSKYDGPYTIVGVNKWPNEDLGPGDVFISSTEGVVIYNCPCGECGQILGNLSQEKKEKGQFKGAWTITTVEVGALLDMHPSVQRNSGCHSHFFIHNGYVKWC